MTENQKDLTSMSVAAVVAVASSLGLLLLDRTGNDARDGMITSAVVARAGAVAFPSEPPRIEAPRTLPAFNAAD
jgi:hypothetical protein